MTHARGRKRERQDIPFHANYDYKCTAPACEFRTNEEVALKMHRKLMHNENTEGVKTDIMSSLETELLMELMKDAPTIPTFKHENKYICLACGFTTRKKSSFDVHVRSHTGEKPFECKLCSYRTSYKYTLLEHKRSHTGERPFSCDLCERTFPQTRNLTRHLAICKKRPTIGDHSTIKEHVCGICSVSFHRRNYLLAHMRVHSARPYECSVCKKSFNYHSHLKTHMYVHTNGRPYKCNVCNSSFRRSEHLKCHMRVHTGEKPFICDWCERAFALKGTLTSHQRVCKRKQIKIE